MARRCRTLPPAEGYGFDIYVDRIWSAAELEALTPDERAATIRAGFVTDPDDGPAALVDRARHKVDARIAAAEDRHTRQ